MDEPARKHRVSGEAYGRRWTSVPQDVPPTGRMVHPIARRRARRGVVQPVEPSSAPWRVLETTEPNTTQADDAPRGVPRVAIVAAALTAIVAVAALLVVMRPSADVAIDGMGTMDAGSGGHGGTESTDPASASRELVVEVAGAVRRPGVYRLPEGARVGDAISAAGGYGATVDAGLADRQLNLAALVHDGDEVRVPRRGEVAADSGGSGSAGGSGSGSGGGGSGTSSGGQASGSGGLVDLNHATAQELDTLPGVGPATAAKIITAREERPFASVDDLGARKVVGAATLEKLRARATTTP